MMGLVVVVAMIGLMMGLLVVTMVRLMLVMMELMVVMMVAQTRFHYFVGGSQDLG